MISLRSDEHASPRRRAHPSFNSAAQRNRRPTQEITFEAAASVQAQKVGPISSQYEDPFALPSKI